MIFLSPRKKISANTAEIFLRAGTARRQAEAFPEAGWPMPPACVLEGRGVAAIL